MLKKDRKPTIKFIRELGEQGPTYEQMAEKLNERGVMPRPNKIWTMSGVAQFCHYWAVFKKTNRRQRKIELYEAKVSATETPSADTTDELKVASLILASSLSDKIKQEVLKGLFR